MGSIAPPIIGVFDDRATDKRDVRWALLVTVGASYVCSGALFWVASRITGTGAGLAPVPRSGGYTRHADSSDGEWINVFEEGSTGSFSLHDSPDRHRGRVDSRASVGSGHGRGGGGGGSGNSSISGGGSGGNTAATASQPSQLARGAGAGLFASVS